MKYDVLLVGATGQVGRYILRHPSLHDMSVAVLMRRASKKDAASELSYHFNGPLPQNIDILLGDALTCNLPTARHVFNAAGYTRLNSTIDKHWGPNVILSLRLAEHSFNVNAQYHHFSTVSAAMFRKFALTEALTPRLAPRNIPYTASKITTELLLPYVANRYQIYRIGDVVPDRALMKHDFRRNHWMSILFGCGKSGFEFIPSDRIFYVLTGTDIANCVMALAFNSTSNNRHHVLGYPYTLKYLSQFSGGSGSDIGQRIAKRVSHLLWKDETWVWPIDNGHTLRNLTNLGVEHEKLGDNYWRLFSSEARSRLFRGETPTHEYSYPGAGEKNTSNITSTDTAIS